LQDEILKKDIVLRGSEPAVSGAVKVVQHETDYAE